MSKEKVYDCEITLGDDGTKKNADKDTYGLIIWLDTTDRKKADKLSDKIIKHLETLDE